MDEYMRGSRAGWKKSFFKILSIDCSFYNCPPIKFDFGEASVANDSRGGYFTLFLGKNGVCKSSLLRELIDFIIDVRSPYPRSRWRKSHVSIQSMKYVIDDDVYEIKNAVKGYSLQKNNNDVTIDGMKFPLIIASTMGIFDKFPVNKPDRNTRYNRTISSRYDLKYYHYVGPKANNNLFASKSNVILQQLLALTSIKNDDQLKLIGGILDFMGYEPMVVFHFSSWGEHRDKTTDVTWSQDVKRLYESIQRGYCSFDMKFDDDLSNGDKMVLLRSLNILWQNGYLRGLKCYFMDKNNQLVDSDYFSSGEFNLLCIVMSVVLAGDSQHLLVLLDEPEISQHPNWQLDLIPNLEKALSDYGCHFLIATHCHFLVSNLPINRSNVICMSRNSDSINNIITANSIPSDTYGWSAEEVLLKAFGVPTDRNRYLAQMVSDFLKRIGSGVIDDCELNRDLEFFKSTAGHLNESDPLKKILDTIIKELNK